MEALEILALTASEFSNEPEDLRRQYLLMASEEVPIKIIGAKRVRAIAALAAHYMTLGHKGREGLSEISSVTEGEVSVTYATHKGEIKNDLHTTKYGLIYERLIKGHVITPVTRMCL